MHLKIEVEREADALAKAKALALRVMADMEHGEPMPVGNELFSIA